ncbi:universal stress protein [Leisingera sp. ANG59]|uniref:universal stress protein n=1 Tax=Leisingera sp. ANG59 TaxID=2675221 RepID=UPI00157487D5|nr:universal stress protein [Leisingera sp. ANG59]NSY39331.1 universal stress protein [Leisingera sp. ANG59]
MFKRIVVGLDGSEMSETALRTACDLARNYQSKIYVVHTPQPHTVAFALGAVAGYHTVTTMPSMDEVKKATDNILAKGREIAGEYGLEFAGTRSNRGNPVDEIIACAEECDADLIVTGRRGLGSVGALIQGSTSLGISHQAKCACLTVL